MKLHKDFVMEYKLLGEWGAQGSQPKSFPSTRACFICSSPGMAWTGKPLATSWMPSSNFSLPALRVLHSAERIVLGGGSQSQNTPERVLLSSTAKLLNVIPILRDIVSS